LQPTIILEHIPTEFGTPVLIKWIEHKERGRERLRLFAHDMWSKRNKLIDENIAAAKKSQQTDGITKDLRTHVAELETTLASKEAELVLQHTLVKELVRQAKKSEIRHMEAEQRHQEEMARVLANTMRPADEGLEQLADDKAPEPEESEPVVSYTGAALDAEFRAELSKETNVYNDVARSIVQKKALDRTCVQSKDTGRRLTEFHKVFTHFEANAWVDQRLDVIIPRKLEEYWSAIQVGVEDEIMSRPSLGHGIDGHKRPGAFRE
jgi:ATP-dependent Lon protease